MIRWGRGSSRQAWWNTNIKAAVKHSDPRASSFAFEVTTRHHVGSISPPTDSANVEARGRENFFFKKNFFQSEHFFSLHEAKQACRWNFYGISPRFSDKPPPAASCPDALALCDKSLKWNISRKRNSMGLGDVPLGPWAPPASPSLLLCCCHCL